MSTSDTPRTDAEAFETDYPNSGECVDVDFARNLERDLTRLTAANKALVEALMLAKADMRRIQDSPLSLEPVIARASRDRIDAAIAAQTTQDKGTM